MSSRGTYNRGVRTRGWTVLVLAAVAGVAAPAPARGASLLDEPAPSLAGVKWLSGGTPPDWKSLKGRPALLELVDPDDIVSQGLISRTVEVVARAGPTRMVAVTVTVGSGSDEGTSRGFADSGKVTWNFGRDPEGRIFAAAGRPDLPRWFLLAPDGRVTWEGSPVALDDAVLDTHLERARLWRPEEVSKPLRPAAALFASGRYGHAVKAAREAMEAVEKRRSNRLEIEEGVDRDFAAISEGVKSMAEIRLTIAARLADLRDSLDALELLEGIERGFDGSEWATKATKATEAKKALFAVKKHELEILQGRRLREILAKATPPTRRNLEKTLELLTDFIGFNVNMRVAERAEVEKKRIEKALDPKKKTSTPR